MGKQWIKEIIKINILLIVVMTLGLTKDTVQSMGLLNLAAMFLASLTIIVCLSDRDLTEMFPQFRKNVLLTNLVAAAETILVLAPGMMLALLFHANIQIYYSLWGQIAHILLGLSVANLRIAFGVETISQTPDEDQLDLRSITASSWQFLKYTSPMIIAIIVVAIVEAFVIHISIYIAVVIFALSLFACMYQK
ncbi:hypothetical protein SAMN05421767_12028 [Granulicatella balaenopterae]|uniref:Uncharacterized protein n=1 Tax=Granulicatella balaenopterae TaxID=137733 RepID=A0A1H9LPD7_9LACT|nr:hypothetical protein [Granulicatella balaenopterae]SER12733.1 hypothetical protein SAMN05421767_12028 [Granulicatella balaenopterae]